MKNIKILSSGKTIAKFEMGASAHKYEGCELDFEKSSQFYYKGEWFIVVYQYHSQTNVIIPCNVYARYSSLYNKFNAVRNGDCITIDDKPLPKYNGRLKSAFAIC